MAKHWIYANIFLAMIAGFTWGMLYTLHTYPTVIIQTHTPCYYTNKDLDRG
jgi:hypothetical protein